MAQPAALRHPPSSNLATGRRCKTNTPRATLATSSLGLRIVSDAFIGGLWEPRHEDHPLPGNLARPHSTRFRRSRQAADLVTYEGQRPGGGPSTSYSSPATRSTARKRPSRCWQDSSPVRHGFNCTVLFPINPADHTISPVTVTNIPAWKTLDTADLCVLGLRFRECRTSKMKHFVDYLKAGQTVIALRTSTHAFSYQHNKESPYPNTIGAVRPGRAVSGPSSARRVVVQPSTASTGKRATAASLSRNLGLTGVRTLRD